MKKKVIKEGDVFTNWTVLSSERKDSKVLCKCKCGKQKYVQIYCLFNKSSKSCGCLTKRPTKNCLVCGKEFSYSRDRINPRFCSLKCRGKGEKMGIYGRKRNYLRFNCKFCGKQFKVVKRAYKYGRAKPKYCSLECSNNSKRGKPKKRNGESYVQKIAENARCEICGYDRFIENAHVKPACLGGEYELGNIIFLCPNHHRLLDECLLKKEEENKIKEKVKPKLSDCDISKISNGRIKKYVKQWQAVD